MAFQYLVTLYAFLEAGSQELKVVNIDKDNIELKYQYTLKSHFHDVRQEIRKNSHAYYVGRKPWKTK